MRAIRNAASRERRPRPRTRSPGRGTRRPSWRKGFLAGIFDAEGSCSARHLRISEHGRGDHRMDAPNACERFGFDSSSRTTTGRTGCAACACAAALPEQLRFFHTVDPAITRKRSIEGARDQVRRRPARGGDRAARDRDADVRHHDRHRRLHRQRRGQPQLLRPSDARVPGSQRGAGLRARDRRQGQRARGAAGRAGAAVVGRGARRAGHEHRPVPVGRGALQAHARDLGGDAGLQRTRARS